MANKTAKEKNQPSRRKLHDSEYYNPKTKRYEYRYKDIYGRSRVVSSYSLEPTDQIPNGKRSGKSLREKEAEIQGLLADGVDVDGAKQALVEVAQQYLDFLYSKKEIKKSTQCYHSRMIRMLERTVVGHMEVGKIKPVHAEVWLKEMRETHGRSTLINHIAFVKSVCEYALDHDYIAKNPFRHVSMSRGTEKREAISFEQMNKFLGFCKDTPSLSKYYPMIYILFWTGLRVSELCGLTMDDLDFVNRFITVEKQTGYIDGQLIVSTTKTASSVRTIPMTDGVYQCLREVADIRERQGAGSACYDLDGNRYENFVFLTVRSHHPLSRCDAERYLNRCVSMYNQANPDCQIELTPHICRHTFATNMQKLPPKTLQTILGHSEISTTMDIYVSRPPVEEQRKEVNALAYELFTN